MRKMLRVLHLALCALVLSACIAGDVEEGDRELVVRIGQLQPYGLSLPEGFESYEKFSKHRWLDGSVVIDYEFDAPLDLDLPYLSVMSELHPTNDDACASYRAGNVGVPLGLGGPELSIRDDIYEYGDESRFAYLLTLNDEPMGMYFAMCSGRTAFMLVTGGVYFEDSEQLAELLDPVLERLVALE